MDRNLYDELDPLYREIWGTALHHGLWLTGNENAEQARQNLISKIIASLDPKGTIADIGCGYGTLSRRLVQEFSCHVLANTNARAQAKLIPDLPDLTISSGNWLAQNLPDQSLDSALAVESLSHFSSFDRFLAHTAPALKSGGRLIIADWYSDSGHHPLLRFLSSAGRLPTWRSLDSLISTARRHHLHPIQTQDLSLQVAPTWTRLFAKSLLLPLLKPSLLPLLMAKSLKHPALLTAFPLIRLAYQTGDIQYHLVSFQK